MTDWKIPDIYEKYHECFCSWGLSEV